MSRYDIGQRDGAEVTVHEVEEDVMESRRKKPQFDLTMIFWVISLVAFAAAFFKAGVGLSQTEPSAPDAFFFAMLISLYPAWWLTRKRNPGLRFGLVGSLMLTIVMCSFILAVSEYDRGGLTPIVWFMRVAAVAFAATIWIVCMLLKTV